LAQEGGGELYSSRDVVSASILEKGCKPEALKSINPRWR
jgi:hypothetical protein